MVHADAVWPQLGSVLQRYDLKLERVADAVDIPGSYWGESEAGLRGAVVYARADTPAHSVLHETSHVVCMSGARRAVLDTDAGGGYDEENAVCYLQILLGCQVYGTDIARVCADMDAWGYTFRLGSAQAWFERDAGEPLAWLQHHRLLDAQRTPTFRKRA